jgi:hypothetical protein
LTKAGTARRKVWANAAEGWVIQYVEEVGFELNVNALSEVELAPHTQIYLE